MLIEKSTVNVGENTAIYVESYSPDTSVGDLKYGDTKWDDDKQMLLWHGESEGWIVDPFGGGSFSGAILNLLTANKESEPGTIWRIKNNDIDFNETAYLAEAVNTIEPDQLAISQGEQ